MTDKNIDGQEVQKKIADKLTFAASRLLAIESMKEQIEEVADDLVALFKECGEKISKPEAKLKIAVYADAAKQIKDSEDKIQKAKETAEKVKAEAEELSVYDQYKPNLADEADKLLG